MINWGFVDGKTQTRYPWDSWQKPYTQSQPVVWHHDVFHADGKPYRQAEVDLIRAATVDAQAQFAKKKGARQQPPGAGFPTSTARSTRTPAVLSGRRPWARCSQSRSRPACGQASSSNTRRTDVIPGTPPFASQVTSSGVLSRPRM